MVPAAAALDLDLASRCARGDRNAQRELFDSQRRRVHSTLYRVLGSNRDMEDLVQEAFVEIFRSLPSFRGEARLATWVDRIAARTAYRYLRRKREPRLEALPELPVGGGVCAESRFLAREASRRLYRVLDRIEARQRVAFALHVLDGRPLRDVARVTGASLVAVKTRVWRARREIYRRARRDPVLAAFVGDAAPGEGKP